MNVTAEVETVSPLPLPIDEPPSSAKPSLVREVPQALAPFGPGSEPQRPRGLSHLLMTLLRALNVPARAYDRLLLSRAKHGSLTGHPRMALRFSRLVPFY